MAATNVPKPQPALAPMRLLTWPIHGLQALGELVLAELVATTMGRTRVQLSAKTIMETRSQTAIVLEPNQAQANRARWLLALIPGKTEGGAAAAPLAVRARNTVRSGAKIATAMSQPTASVPVQLRLTTNPATMDLVPSRRAAQALSPPMPAWFSMMIKGFLRASTAR